MLALALTIAVAFPNLGTLYAAGVSAPEAQAQGKIRNARRLGGPTSLNRPSLTNIESLRKMMSKPGMTDDIRKVLGDAGLPDTSSVVIAAMTTGAFAGDGGSCGDTMPADGSIVDCDFQPNGVMEWMALRPNIAKKDRTAGIIGPVRWAARRPFKAFLFRVTNNNRLYTFVVPKDCGNLALLSDVAAPPPPPPPAPAPKPTPPPPPVQPTVQEPAKPPAEIQQASKLECVVKDSSQKILPGMTVRLRNQKGEIIATTTTNERGECFFANIPAGDYVLEVVDPATGKVVSTTAAAAGVAVVAATAAGIGTIAAAAAGGLTLFGLGTAATLGVLAGAGLLTAVAIKEVKDDASPSR